MSGAELDEAQVLQLVDNRLARFKRPKQVIVCAALPKTALG
jgi:acyl-coenzyme A synthetase/AMP-(fatty) acid ligase